MAYDGIVISGVIWELSGLLEGSRITKIYQAEKDEILLTCNKNGENYKLLISCNPSNPRLHLTRTQKENPLVAPQFCMVLRKHIQGGKINKICQWGFDRIVEINIDTYNEMGDPVTKKLIVEIMGRHSNIILTGQENIIYDAIKHVDERTNSLREILPARHYLPPPAQEKTNPDDTEGLKKIFDDAMADSEKSTLSVSKVILNSVSGTSPLLCKGICLNAGIDPDVKLSALRGNELYTLTEALLNVSKKISERNYTPFILSEEDRETGIVKYCDFHCFDTYSEGRIINYSSLNLMLDEFYTKKDTEERLRQKKANLVKSVNTAISRTERKIDIYEGDIRSAENYDVYRIKGELITANVYRIKSGDKETTLENYYEENCPLIKISLDENLSPAANAQQYFKKYRKKKSTYENANRNMTDALSELEYLKSVETLLANCTDTADIAQIREELAVSGYLNQTANNKPNKKGQKNRNEAKHLVVTVSDGYEVWVGKNNLQNDLITGKLAAANDIWLHVKNAPGSHVILRTSLMGGEFTKASIEDAARLAAIHSSYKNPTKAEVDFTRVKYVKKPAGSRPGKVIYTNQKTIIIG